MLKDPYRAGRVLFTSKANLKLTKLHPFTIKMGGEAYFCFNEKNGKSLTGKKVKGSIDFACVHSP